ncbi:hypothetical protein PGIGA_G00059310 [Pangasianodon gigas]|uniref:Uncharacterized protein n=1 Tax=Pangasianodon gigas TaxID=30993 RepID=A0ACC5X4K1_PANGG|nr:hypothetical protein [Pangasianodon gigas]
MEKKRSEVKKLIRAQEKAELSRVERLLEQLEQEIADLKRRVTELEQLSHTHDHIHFLQSFPSLCVPPGCEDSPSITVDLSFDGLIRSQEKAELSRVERLLKQLEQEIADLKRRVTDLEQLSHTHDHIHFLQERSQAAVDDSERIFTELISTMEKKCSEVKKLIRSQEKAELSRVERLLKQLKQEIADLKRRVNELEQLSHTHDHIHFLQVTLTV